MMAGQSIRFPILGARAVGYRELETSEKQRTASLVGVQSLLGVTQVLYFTVICQDNRGVLRYF